MMDSARTKTLLDRQDAEAFAARLRWVIALESPNPMLARHRLLKFERPSLGTAKYRKKLGL